ILNVTQGTEMGQLAFTIKADGTLRYQDFFLGNPDRLVVDFVDVTSRAPIRNMEVNEGPVRKVRLAQFSAASPKVARLVLDLSARAPYRIVEGSDRLKIGFGEAAAPRPPAPRTRPHPHRAPPAGGGRARPPGRRPRARAAPPGAGRRAAARRPGGAAPARAGGPPGAQHEHRGEGLHRPSDQPRLQGRRPP